MQGGRLLTSWRGFPATGITRSFWTEGRVAVGRLSEPSSARCDRAVPGAVAPVPRPVPGRGKDRRKARTHRVWCDGETRLEPGTGTTSGTTRRWPGPNERPLHAKAALERGFS